MCFTNPDFLNGNRITIHDERSFVCMSASYLLRRALRCWDERVRVRAPGGDGALVQLAWVIAVIRSGC